MDKRPQLSRSDTLIILSYIGAIFVSIFLFYIVGIFQNGLPLPIINSSHMEIAVLIPKTGDQAELGKNIEKIAEESLAFYMKNNPHEDWDISIQEYDAGNDVHTAAFAALSAAKNPSTIAIVGPINARQVLAAAETIKNQPLAIISQASTAYIEDISNFNNVYGIPAPDIYQADAIVEYLSSKKLNKVFLIVDHDSYSAKILMEFIRATENRITIAGIISLETGVPADFAKNLSNSNANAIIFIGGPEYFGEIVANVEKAKPTVIPIIGVEAINDEKIAANLTGAEQIFFTSSILMNKGFEDRQLPSNYLEAIGNLDRQPYVYETSQAVWIILATLNRVEQHSSPRIDIQKILNEFPIRSESGETVRFYRGQMVPAYIYVYDIKNSSESPIDRFPSP